MNDLIWCASCGEDASLARAVSELPCPACGCRKYTVLSVTSDTRDSLLSLCERMQRMGCWDVAEKALRKCFELEYISRADYNLTSRALSWRKECADSARAFIRESASALTVEELRGLLLREYDDYTVEWILSDYDGLSRVPFGETYIVEVSCDAAQET